MTPDFKYETQYFVQEGKANLENCLAASFQAAIDHSIEKLVIFTGAGVGVRMAVEQFQSQPLYSGIQLIAVTFPHRSKLLPDSDGDHTVSTDTRKFLQEHQIPLVMAHMPFEPIESQYAGRGLLGQDLSLIGHALSIFCGSMSLCVQAVLMACDAGHVDLGEHIICLTSDTSILVRAANTSRLLTDFIVREIVCKPVLLTLGKGEKTTVAQSPEDDVPQAALGDLGQLPLLGSDSTGK